MAAQAGSGTRFVHQLRTPGRTSSASPCYSVAAARPVSCQRHDRSAKATAPFASSSSVYSRMPRRLHRERGARRAPNVYAATKRANEVLATTFTEKHALSTVGLRFFTVYGTGLPAPSPATTHTGGRPQSPARVAAAPCFAQVRTVGAARYGCVRLCPAHPRRRADHAARSRGRAAPARFHVHRRHRGRHGGAAGRPHAWGYRVQPWPRRAAAGRRGGRPTRARTGRGGCDTESCRRSSFPRRGPTSSARPTLGFRRVGLAEGVGHSDVVHVLPPRARAAGSEGRRRGRPGQRADFREAELPGMQYLDELADASTARTASYDGITALAEDHAVRMAEVRSRREDCGGSSRPGGRPQSPTPVSGTRTARGSSARSTKAESGRAQVVDVWVI